MSVTTTTKPTADVDVDKTGSTVTGRFTIKNLPSFDVAEATKPLFAFVGVADLAIEQAKDVPADVTARVSKVQARLSEVPAQVKTLPTQVKTLSDDLTEKATDLYTQLTLRGERLVTQIRRQPATEAAIAEGKEAVRKAEAAAIAAKKSAKAGERAVEDAAAKIG
jgi:predicted  nucleic acid-binding Zn-ribbon protein